VLVERRRVVRGAGLVRVGIEQVRRRRAVVCLGHHAVVVIVELLVVGNEQRRVVLRLPRCGREDCEIGVAKAGCQQTVLFRVALLGSGGAERGGVFGFQLVGEALIEIERRRGLSEGGLAERLRRGLLAAQEAAGVGIVCAIIGLSRREFETEAER